jgi:tetratricopeptide (TPR) repeat protein
MACAPKGSNEQPVAEVVQSARADEEEMPRVVPVVVALTPPTRRGAFRWETETIGVYTLLLEAGLFDLEGVIVVTADKPLPMGVRNPLGQLAAERWTVALNFPEDPDPDALEVEIELCNSSTKSCRSTSTTGNREAPQIAINELLIFAQQVLDRAPSPGASDQWLIPVSQDPYAVLICGRAAAAWYSMIEEEPSDEPRGGLVFKAVNLDPSMPLAQWLLARQYAELGNFTKAMPHYAAAREGRPRSMVLLADEAMAMAAENRELAAADQWEAVLEAVPYDPRFLLARVETDLDAKRLSVARANLDRLTRTWGDDSGIAASRVRLADLSGEEEGVDELLARWQETDPGAVEPVRRRVQLRIRRGDYQQAWDMLPVLRERGADALANSYQIPLGVALEQWEVAAGAAMQTNQPVVAARIRARAALTRDPSRVPELGEATSDGLIVLGQVALNRGDQSGALAYAERADRARPWDPDALKLLRDVYSAMGNRERASALAARIRAIEPDPPALFISTKPLD